MRAKLSKRDHQNPVASPSMTKKTKVKYTPPYTNKKITRK